MAKGRKKKFALVWWANDGLTSIEDWSSIPGKREIDSMVNLLWKPADGKTMRLPAKILAIDSKYYIYSYMYVYNLFNIHGNEYIAAIINEISYRNNFFMYCI